MFIDLPFVLVGFDCKCMLETVICLSVLKATLIVTL